ncbi:5' nucleotidase, NT5C type [Cohnella thailandensis]|jgi:Uncharacterized conserved protein|uniref:Nucleotidase n=1 Tax=Cohnella thailandensis TaxID=557557 RepID=A0A841SVA2_9BACL|nr:HAD hydrolase-like protein [Cohnella thailandensis]MBB6634919.1 HAD hydrolase-like protein [Cohnella thailandensis]MBP1975859.1 putative HAD superfamily protein [Cohnella thailandensis]
MKFGFDIDDTLINLREHAFNLYQKKLNKSVEHEKFLALKSVPIHELFGMTTEEGGRMWNSLREEIYYTDCPPFPHAVEALQELIRQGHEVYYITARAPEYCERTKQWIAEAGFPVEEGRFYCGMGDTEKVHIIRKLGLDYYFDDKPAVLDTLMELPLKVYVRDNSYNRHLDIPRITTWSELLEILREAGDR